MIQRTSSIRLGEALLEISDAEDDFDVDAAVASLEEAAELASTQRWWDALELWQVHCATRRAAAATRHRSERNEFLVDAKLREGGALQIPIDERSLAPADRGRLAGLDRRASDAAAQMGLDDVSAFQAALESRGVAERVAVLRDGVHRETERLAARAAVRRAFDAS